MKRFWSKVEKTKKCWVWTAGLTTKGYGSFRFNSKVELAHRVSFILKHNRLPKACVLHECDNPKCVRPSHLFEGTIAINNEDRRIKGRRQKLTPIQIQQILKLKGKLRLKEIAKLYNITDSMVCYLFANPQTIKHLLK